jgi:hypothetical protein
MSAHVVEQYTELLHQYEPDLMTGQQMSKERIREKT